MTSAAPFAFRYLERETLVATAATAHVEWLRDCLEPHFCAHAARAGDWRVAFSADPDGYRELASQGRSPGNAMPFFTLDSHRVMLPPWKGGGPGEIVAFDEEFEVFYTVRPDRREVDVLATDLRPWGRVALLRVVRELATDEAIAAGGVFLHAAAFDRDGIVYLIAGPKNAGKTTLLIHVLASCGTRFVANDRVLVRHSGKQRDVRGMPTLVNVRVATRAVFASRFDPHGFGPDSGCLTHAEREHERQRGAARHDEPLILSPRQFVESLGTAACAGGRLGGILFPVVSAAHDGIEITELPRATVEDHLASALFPSVSRSEPPGVLDSQPPGASLQRAWLSELAAEPVPMLRCSLGRNAYGCGATSVLDALGERTHA